MNTGFARAEAIQSEFTTGASFIGVAGPNPSEIRVANLHADNLHQGEQH
jgi:hypothetical protein